MDAIYELKDLLEKEIKKVTAKGDISPTEVKTVGEAVDILKDIETICAMKEYGNDDSSYAMSNRGYSTMRIPMDRMYRDSYEGSYRGSYDSYDDMSYRRGRSRDNYSRHDQREEMIMKLEQKLKNARSEEERKTIMDCINDLERG